MDLSIYEEIHNERIAQDDKWGGPRVDDANRNNDWVAYIAKHVGSAVSLPWDKDRFRVQMIRVGALAVAAVEWCDRLPVKDD